jgi:PAS domain S-box-containing protein
MIRDPLTGSLRETLAVFGTPGTPQTTSEVAEALDLGRRSTYDRLSRLVDCERLRTKKVGASGRVWWRPPAETGDVAPTGEFPSGEAVSQERELLQQVFEASPAGIAVLDDDGVIIRASDRAEELLGLTVSEMEGRAYDHPEWDIWDEAGDPIAPERHPVTRVLATGEPVFGFTHGITLPDGTERWLSSNSAPVLDESGDVERVITVVEDATQLKEQARRLRRQRDELESELADVLDRVSDGFYGLDEEFRFEYLNEQTETALGVDRSAAIGTDIRDELDLTEPFEAALETAIESQAPVFLEDYYEPLEAWFENSIYPSETGVSVYFREVTDRKRRERELEQSRNRYQTLVDNFPNGAVALVDEDLRYATVGGSPIEDAALSAKLEGERVEDALSPDLADVLVPRYAAALQGEESATETDVGDRTYRFRILPVRNDEGEVFAAIGMSQDVTEQKAHERELERQGERLAALNDLNRVVREVTDAVVDQSTRSDVEQVLCTALADSDSYTFAWVGDVDTASETVRLRAEAGVEGYLDDITISVDPDDRESAGATGRAVLTREMQTTRDVQTDPRYDRWRDHVTEYGFRSSAAVPLVHEGVLYGVLNVYAERPNAFAGDEAEVVRHLGDVVSHAIAAIERKRALTSDEVVELKFRIQNVFDSLNVSADVEGRLAVDRMVPVGDDDYVAYGTVPDDAVEVLDTLVETLPHWGSVDLLGAAGGRTRFEVRLVEPPVLSKVSAVGGYVEQALVEDGDYFINVRIAPSADVRRVNDIVASTYPSAQLVSQRQVSRSADSPARFAQVLATELTDRQRSALEAAYFGGYFEWPRSSTGEDVADALGVSAPTFHQHFRKAQHKVFEAVFETV